MSLDLERLSWLSLAASAPLEDLHPRTTPERADASEPPLGPDPERLVFCSLHDVSCRMSPSGVSVLAAISRSDRKAHRAMNLPIGSHIGLPLLEPARGLVGRGGVEPPTSRLSGVRSNHLSYRPNPVRGSSADAPSASSGGHAGGAYRDRTGDLMLAKHALSQLS